METLFTDASCQTLDTCRAMIRHPASSIQHRSFLLTLIINELLALVGRTSRYLGFPFLFLLSLAIIMAACEREDHKPFPQDWSVEANLPDFLQEHRSIVLDDGRILITGGTETRRQALTFDPDNGRLEERSPMLLGRESHEIVSLPGGKAMAIGGFSGNAAERITATCEIYDPEKDAWIPAAPMRVPRASFTATMLADGSIVVTGGFTTPQPSTAACERYFPAEDRWETLAEMHLTRFGHEAVLLENGNIFVISGSLRSFYGEVYSPTSNSWTPTETPAFRFGPLDTRAVPVSDHEILVTLFDTAQIYQVRAGRWQSLKPATEIRGGTEFSQLPDGRFMAVGGQGPINYLSSIYQKPDQILACDIFDPRTKTWVRGPDLHEPKYQHTLHRIGDKLIVIGGSSIETLELE